MPKKVLKFDAEKFNKLIGLDLNQKTCLNYLQTLGFKIRGKIVEIPPERTDVAIFEDLAEEIVNLYGYDKMPSKIPHVTLLPSGYEDLIALKDKVRQILSGFGLSEVYNYSFFPGYVEVANPIAEDKKYLRGSLFPQLEKNVEDNLRFYDGVRIFEIGKIFKSGVVLSFYDREELSLGLAIAGKDQNSLPEIKGIVDQLLLGIGLADYTIIQSDLNKLTIEAPDHRYIGNFYARGKTALAELNLDTVLDLASEEREYQPIPKYPSVMRDLSVVVGVDTRVGKVQNIIENGSHLLDDIDLLDWYEDPKKIGNSRKSLTFRLIFQAKDHTLTDEEVGKEMEKIVAALEDQFEVEVR